jgi:hypothetical protein
VPLPLYSPDIAPSDFSLFGRLKRALPGCRFTEADELFDAIHDVLVTRLEEQLTLVFDGWIEWVKSVIAHNGESDQG